MRPHAAALKALLAGELSAARAKATGAVHLTGQTKLLSRFVEVFRIDRTGPALEV